MLYAARRWLILLGLISLLTGCLALPQTGLFAFRLAVTSLGVEDVRIGPYSINAGLDTSDLTSLIASSLGAGSLPIQATIAMGLGLPADMPPVEMSGFRWSLDMSGVDPVQGNYEQNVTLTSGDDANLRLPVAFDVLEPTPKKWRRCLSLPVSWRLKASYRPVANWRLRLGICAV